MRTDSEEITAWSEKNKNLPFVSLKNSRWRWICLLLACFVVFGGNYCYDFPQALQVYLMDEMGMTSIQYNLLYSVYSFPNVFLTIFGGYLTDKFGARLLTCIYAFILVVGQAVCVIGAIKNSFLIMLVGRFIFGLGGGNIYSSICTILYIWFKNKEVGLALATRATSSRLGSSLNSIFTPLIYSWSGDSLIAPLLVGLGIVFVSWMFSIILFYLDKKADQVEEFSGIKTETVTKKVKMSSIKKFTSSFWLLCLSVVIAYCCVCSFTNIANDFYMTIYGWSNSQAGIIVSLSYIIPAIFCPAVGYGMDKFGKRGHLLVLSSILCATSFFLWYFLPECYQCWQSIVPMVIFGIFYCFHSAAFWSSLPLVVEGYLIGTGIGLVQSLQHIGLIVVPLIVGVLCDQAETDLIGYKHVELLFISMSFCILIVNIIIQIKDHAILNKVYMKELDLVKNPEEEKLNNFQIKN